MVPELAFISFSLFLMMLVASPFLPIFLMWRALALSVPAFVAARLLEETVHPSGQSFAESSGLILVIYVLLFISIPIALRLIAALSDKQLNYRSFAGPVTRWRLCLDKVILGSAGSVAALWLAGYLASTLSGVTGGVLLDLAVGLTAAVGGLVLYRTFKWNSFGLVFFSVLAAIAFAGSLQTNHILKQSERLADGRSWCLEIPVRNEPVSSVKQLGFFSMTKGFADGRRKRHLVLFFADRTGQSHYAYWSVREQQFIEEGVLHNKIPGCELHPDFESLLTAE
ncbi:hypothetical protein PsAD2_02949 [Pseudovibrio axinellae]|uniref:Uncharacterized protein n=1 Tax=Pseudovibrio axinellae TaxID=989403 RepID=A0A165XDX3_9HYPH|nr:hypothetical protein [Pseudovibrio axinellae]KZL17613.1 hypothetical protein PsAD2_02949 [Pseudovibrio axinellae]SER46236.1 hypothetical protein SAMN05421798_110133 [Pseudovibrio axinellae]